LATAYLDTPTDITLHLKDDSLFLRADITSFVGQEPALRSQYLLLDCGATLSFCDENFAARKELPIKVLPFAINLTLIDGEGTSPGQVTHYTDVELTLDNGLKQIRRFLLTKINAAHPFVLDWFKSCNPIIDWEKPAVSFRRSSGNLRAINLFSVSRIPNRQVTIETVPDEDEIKHEKRCRHPDYNPMRYPIVEFWDPKGRKENKKKRKNKQCPDLLYTPMQRWTKLKQRSLRHPLFLGEHRIGKKQIPVDNGDKQMEDPDDGDEKIRLIGAAPFAHYVNSGAIAFQVHIRPVSNESTSEHLRAAPNMAKESKEETEKHTPTDEELFKKQVPAEYHEYRDVFSEQDAKTLPPHRNYDLKIETVDNQDPPFGKIYNMSATELEALKNYIDEMLGKGFIRSSSSPSGAPVLFVKKKNGSLRLCVDYRGLNRITIRNRYPLPLSGDLMDRLGEAKIFSKIDLRVGYNNVRIAEGHEWKTAFRTRYGSYEYLVMPFGLTNAPSAFQHFMNDIFHDLLDVCVVVYLDDILIYSADEEIHKVHVRQVLERLRRHELHARPEKSFFHTDTIEYLGVMVSPQGISMDPAKVETITRWPEPQNVKEVQSFLGFSNFYRRFIDNYSGITKALTNLTRKDQLFEWTNACQSAFDLLKKAFTQAPVLCHFSPDQPIVMECDASDYAIAGILSQYDNNGDIHPLAFFSRTMQSAELNYDIYDKELLAIVDCFRLWRPYLEGSKYTIQVYTDHNNLQYFTTMKQLSRRQARWSERLSGFDFTINYRPGHLGAKPDALTRQPDVYPKKQFQADVNSFNNKILIPSEQLRSAIILQDEVIMSAI
jgi:hypothetical protein